DANEGVTLVDETHEKNDQHMFDIGVLDDEEVVAEKEITTADPVTAVGEVVTTVGVEVSTTAITSQISMYMDEITLATALIDIKTLKPKEKGTVMQEPNHELAEILQAEEQREVTIKERSKLFVELMNEKKKQFARLRTEDKRRKPPAKTHKRKIISTYLKT
nr:hypothetical protein [Tanacetum cinerariifolium]